MTSLVEKLRRIVRLATGAPGCPLDRHDVETIKQAADTLDGGVPTNPTFPLMPNDLIIKTLNHLIRGHATEINWRLSRLQKCAKDLDECQPFHGPGPTSYETRVRPLPFNNTTHLDTSTLEDMQRLIASILSEEKAMMDLQRRKLALLGDIDYDGAATLVAIHANVDFSNPPSVRKLTGYEGSVLTFIAMYPNSAMAIAKLEDLSNEARKIANAILGDDSDADAVEMARVIKDWANSAAQSAVSGKR